MNIRGLFGALIAIMLLAHPLAAQTAHGWDANGRSILVTLPAMPQAGIQSLTVNGRHMTGNVKIEAQGATFDPATNTVLFSETPGVSKGAGTQGNTTISGSLTVTGATFLGSNTSTPTYTFGPHLICHAAPAASTTITITADETEIADAGATVTLTLPGAPASGQSRRITLINESATYNATDGGSNTVAPGTKLDLVWDVTAAAWK